MKLDWHNVRLNTRNTYGVSNIPDTLGWTLTAILNSLYNSAAFTIILQTFFFLNSKVKTKHLFFFFVRKRCYFCFSTSAKALGKVAILVNV